jgi:hypothetical protein
MSLGGGFARMFRLVVDGDNCDMQSNRSAVEMVSMDRLLGLDRRDDEE